jgi:hypothetical protein
MQGIDDADGPQRLHRFGKVPNRERLFRGRYHAVTDKAGQPRGIRPNAVARPDRLQSRDGPISVADEHGLASPRPVDQGTQVVFGVGDARASQGGPPVGGNSIFTRKGQTSLFDLVFNTRANGIPRSPKVEAILAETPLAGL